MAVRKSARSVGASSSARAALPPATILVIDIGGTKVKLLASGQTEPRKFPSGKKLTPTRMVERIKELARDWDYDAVSIGYPGLVGPHGPRSEPGNLGSGWVGFDFAAALERPVRFMNDASMQALGSYDGGRMLFLGLGTGLGSTLIAENVIVPLELGQLMHKSGDTLGNVLGRKGLAKLGKEPWREAAREAVSMLLSAFVVDYVVLGGGNAKLVRNLPHGIRRGHNLTAFRGGLRVWNLGEMPTLAVPGEEPRPAQPPPAEWRVI